jgi:hypothetical protein
VDQLVDAWQLDSAEAYANVPRLGRKNRIGARQRARLWPIFAATREAIAARGFHSWAQVFAEVTTHYAGREQKPFQHIVVDEAQDAGVAELRLFKAIAPAAPSALFFAGDLGQRIFQQPFSWASLGVDVRGRAQTLKVNYRTSHQRRPKSTFSCEPGTNSIAPVPPPATPVMTCFNCRNWVTIRRVASRSAPCHLAKRLEFKAVAVACDDEILPLQSRIESAANEAELDEIYETERQLLYVACTRARNRLLISGVAPGPEFLKDFAG